MIKGIDVSYAQGRPNWKLVKESKEVDFVYVKASEDLALRGPDVSFEYNWKSLQEEGIPRGAYHFYRSSVDPVKQAEAFYSIVKELLTEDMPPVIDVEVPPPAEQTTIEYAENVKKFIGKAEELFKRKVVVYTGGPIFNSSTKGASQDVLDFISDRDLWLAAYVTNPDKFVPVAWMKRKKSWIIWQKSGDIGANNSPGKRIQGIKGVVDYNEFQTEISSLPDWIKSSYLSKQIVVANEEIEVEISIEHPIEKKSEVDATKDISEQTNTSPKDIEKPVKNLFEILFGYIKIIFSIFFRGNK